MLELAAFGALLPPALAPLGSHLTLFLPSEKADESSSPAIIISPPKRLYFANGSADRGEDVGA